MNFFVVIGAAAIIGAIVWYAWFTRNEGKPPQSPPTAD